MIYYQTEKGVLYQGDCVEVMRGLPDKSVDLTVTSPPYDDMGEDFNPIPSSGLRDYNGYLWDFKSIVSFSEI